MKSMILRAIALIALSTPALAQSTPNFYDGQVPSAADWNSYFAAKQDLLGYTPVNKAGDTLTGKLITVTPSSARASINLPPGTAPSSPSNGDVWMTSAGLFAQVGGTTVGPLNTYPIPVPVSSGGTSATSAGTARTNLGAAASGANSDITSLSGISVLGPTPVSTGAAGQALISNGGGGNAMKWANISQAVTTIAALRAIPAASAPVISKVHVFGYSAAGDDPGLDYIWDASSSASDNGGNIITPTDSAGNGRWLAPQWDGNVLFFGAACDGTTDDTSKFSAAAAAGSTLIVPAGKTCVISGLSLSSRVSIAGLGGSTLKIPAGGSSDMLTLHADGSSISNIAFDYTGGTHGATSRCLYVYSSANVKISDVSFTGCPGGGIYGYQMTDTIVTNISGVNVGDLYLYGPVVHFASGSRNKFYNISSVGSTNRVLYLGTTTVGGSGDNYDIFSGVYSKNDRGEAVYVANSSYFTGSNIISQGGTADDCVAVGGDSHDGSLTNISITACTGYGISIDGECNDGTVTSHTCSGTVAAPSNIVVSNATVEDDNLHGIAVADQSITSAIPSDIAFVNTVVKNSSQFGVGTNSNYMLAGAQNVSFVNARSIVTDGKAQYHLDEFVDGNAPKGNSFSGTMESGGSGPSDGNFSAYAQSQPNGGNPGPLRVKLTNMQPGIVYLGSPDFTLDPTLTPTDVVIPAGALSATTTITLKTGTNVAQGDRFNITREDSSGNTLAIQSATGPTTLVTNLATATQVSVEYDGNGGWHVVSRAATTTP